MKKFLIGFIIFALILFIFPAVASAADLSIVNTSGRPTLVGTITTDGTSITFNIRAVGQADDGDDINTSKYYSQTHFDNEYFTISAAGKLIKYNMWNGNTTPLLGTSWGNATNPLPGGVTFSQTQDGDDFVYVVSMSYGVLEISEGDTFPVQIKARDFNDDYVESYTGYEGYDGEYSHYNGLYITDTGVFNITIPIPDTTPPVITLIGDETVNLEVGASYTDAGATAVDDVDGDIKDSIVVVNPVDTSIADTYTITYNVSDEAGNPAGEVIRTVIVSKAPTPPVVVEVVVEEEVEEEKAKPKKKEKSKAKPIIEVLGISEITELLGATPTGFTTLWYDRFFDREPDQAGLDVWVAGLESGDITSSDLIKGFVFSEECQAKISGYTDSEFITFLYRVLFDREPDNYGFNAWLARMSAGMTREEVVDRFTHSEEFVNLCNTFGIMPYEGYISITE